MLTLLVTILATAYFVVPELLTRFVVSFYFVRKASTGTRSEEILRAAFWAAVPLFFAWFTRNIGWWKCPIEISRNAQTVFGGLYSEKIFEQNTAAFYSAFRSFTAFNACLLARTYTFVILGAALFGWIALRLGSVRARLKNWPKINNFLHWAFMPRISEWHVALSPMLVHEPKELIVRIDVMTKGGILYRGTVFEKRISSDGDLATLILKDAARMVRADFQRDRTAYENKKAADPSLKKPDTEDYWRKIPGELFLLNGSEISTVNIRHVRPVGILKPKENQELINAFIALRDQLAKHVGDKQLADVAIPEATPAVEITGLS
jgi:hypothetical protein